MTPYALKSPARWSAVGIVTYLETFQRRASTIEELPPDEIVGDGDDSAGPSPGIVEAVLKSTLPVMIVAVGVRLLVSVFGYALQVLVSRSATTAQ